MALINDINTAGASTQELIVSDSLMQILFSGTWADATVFLEKLLPDGTWAAVASFTADEYYIVETVGSGRYRLNTSGTPDIKADVTFPSASAGRVEGA